MSAKATRGDTNIFSVIIKEKKSKLFNYWKEASDNPKEISEAEKESIFIDAKEEDLKPRAKLVYRQDISCFQLIKH